MKGLAKIGGGGTFPRGFVNHQTNVTNAQTLEKISRDTGGNVAVAQSKVFIQNPVDLRGIPAIGRSVVGAIRHTRPTDCIR